jgi:hypothetical protein
MASAWSLANRIASDVACSDVRDAGLPEAGIGAGPGCEFVQTARNTAKIIIADILIKTRCGLTGCSLKLSYGGKNASVKLYFPLSV